MVELTITVKDSESPTKVIELGTVTLDTGSMSDVINSCVSQYKGAEASKPTDIFVARFRDTLIKWLLEFRELKARNTFGVKFPTPPAPVEGIPAEEKKTTRKRKGA